MTQSKKAQLSRAVDGESWLLAWKEPEIREQVSDWGPSKLIARASTTLIKAVDGNFSPLGLGTVELVQTTLMGAPEHDALAEALSGCPHMGRAMTLDNGAMRVLLENVPNKTAVQEEAANVEQAIAALYALNSSVKLHESRAKADPRIAFAVIIPAGATADGPDYGLVFVPKNMAAGLKVVDREHAFADSHVLCDLLGQKHELMERLGFTKAIELDKRLLRNRADYEAQTAGRAA